jgi:hypothetical protein
MLPVITVKLPIITQFHPHHVHHFQVLSLGFPKVIRIRLVQTKKVPLKQEKISQFNVVVYYETIK